MRLAMVGLISSNEVCIYLVIRRRVRKHGAIERNVSIGQRHPVVGVPIGVVAIGNLLRMREPGEPISARGTGVVERLVPDELAGVGLREAGSRTICLAVLMVCFLKMDNIIVPNLRDGHVRV